MLTHTTCMTPSIDDDPPLGARRGPFRVHGADAEQQDRGKHQADDLRPHREANPGKRREEDQDRSREGRRELCTLCESVCEYHEDVAKRASKRHLIRISAVGPKWS